MAIVGLTLIKPIEDEEHNIKFQRVDNGKNVPGDLIELVKSEEEANAVLIGPEKRVYCRIHPRNYFNFRPNDNEYGIYLSGQEPKNL